MLEERTNGVVPAQGEITPPRVATEPRRLLLVEDDFALRAHLAELLMQEGYYVGCAADGEEAIRRLQREPLPAAILLDMMLPRVNGIAFREAQMRTAGLRSIPTIAITSLKDSDHLEKLGFAAVFKKPLDFDTLTRTLARVCPPR